MTPGETRDPESFGPDDVLAHARERAGYDRDLGGLTDALTLPMALAGLLDFVALAAGMGTLVFPPMLALEHTAFERHPVGGLLLSLGEPLAVFLALLISVYLGYAVANPDARLRAAGAPGARLPTRPFGLFTGLCARTRVLRRMRLQRHEPLSPDDPAVFLPFARERSAALRAWAREVLAWDGGGTEPIRAALDRLDAPPEAGESRSEALARSLAALRTALVARAAARDAAALDRGWKAGRLEEPIRLGSPSGGSR